MKSNFSIRLFNELIGKGYKVNDASNDSGDVLEVQVYLDRFDALLWVTLFVSDDDENQTLGQIFVRNIKSISSEKRIQALEYINAINLTGSSLTFEINNQNQICVHREIFSFKNDLFSQFVNFVELFPLFFQSESVGPILNRLLSL